MDFDMLMMDFDTFLDASRATLIPGIDFQL